MRDQTEYYREEARELLDEIERRLIDLENAPEEYENLNALFRAFHTIKGSGSMFGYIEVVDFTHELETMFDFLRDKTLAVSKTVIDISLKAKDHIHSLIFDPESLVVENGRSILADITALYKEQGIGNKINEEAASSGSALQIQGAESVDVENTFRIVFKPDKDFYLRGARIEPLIDELRDMGTLIVFAHSDKVPPLNTIDPESSFLRWTMLLTTQLNQNDIQTVFLFVEDYSSITIDLIDDSSQMDINGAYKKIGEILTETGCVDTASLEDIMNQQKRLGELTVDKGLIAKDDLDAALAEQKYVRELRKKRTETAESLSIRVKSEKLDSLVNLVGEMVTIQARLSRIVEEARFGKRSYGGDLENVTEAMNRLTTELRENAMEIRMVTFNDIFNSFQRLVRDLASELDKNVKLLTLGAETELDKNIIDALKDPLIHIIRNALDHGLESSEERQRSGKPEQGLLKIEARNHSTHVLLTIEDDGRGLNEEKIRSQAIKRGLISENDRLSTKDVFALIFVPGFSTTEVANSLSGRGVGMDVVKRNISQLRGSIEVDSSGGRGTKILLTIPLTLSIIDGLLVRLGSELYILNLQIVDECFELDRSSLAGTGDNRYLTSREVMIPYIELCDYFDITRRESRMSEVVVVKNGDSQVALIVDEIIGQHQTVIKPLNAAMSGIEEITGSSILGDGTIAFILDANKIAEGTIRIDRSEVQSAGV